ncbi:MAG TPA: prolyl oligopeptidase family serine peptidase [Gemmatimonadaceae bacterium]|nr:prolyl oligopeptidase family serine peptidase [Gemmatimonadaceae bacterium]
MPVSVRPALSSSMLIVAAFAAVPVKAQPARRSPLTIERLTATPALIGTAPVSPRWSPDSRTLACLWHDGGRPARTLWVVERTSSTPRRLLPPSDSAPVSEFTWTPAGDTILFLQRGEVRRIAITGGTAAQLTGDGGDKSDLAISPDGRHISFLRDGDLWVRTSGDGTPTRLTSVGVPAIGTVPLGTYHRPDVEIGDATWGGDAPPYRWSPDSKRIAVHHVDRRSVPIMRIPYYLGAAPVLNGVRRSAPGDVNEVRKVGILDVATRALRFIELRDSSSTRVVNYAWSPTGTLLIDRESDDAIARDVHVVEPESLEPRRVWSDRRDTRIYNDIASTWAGDGRQLLLTGDLDDRYRIYALTPGDTALRALTSGPHDVAGAAIANAATATITWVSSEPLPSERHVWQMRADGTQKRRLTTIAGTHAPFVSPDGRTIALLSSSDTTPPELYLLDATAGGRERRITRSQAPEFAATRWLPAEYVTFRSRTATPPLHARILYPPNLDRSKRHPVLFGPVYSNTVRNRWAGLYGTLQQYLAIEKGYIVVQVDVRGSTGYGRDFREKFLMDWGGQDLEDLQSAVEHMKALPIVDSTRLGIWGSSYGGTLTVYSLLRKPGLFAAGVAGAPATDPHFFGSDDVAIARRPQTHPETFTRGALQYAGNLRDHLLIIHGMQDDVVPFATSIALAEEFMRLGKDFDIAFAPAATHAWTQRPQYATYLLRKLVAHFDRYLGPGPR